MLKVLEDGVQITLHGKDKNPLFLFSSVLVVCAILVAIIAMTSPIQTTLLAFFGLACLIFGFNIYKHKLSKQVVITTGTVVIKNNQIALQNQTIKLTQDAQISICDDSLNIEDLGRKWVFVGFENQKELEIVQCVLQGRMLQKRVKTIRLNDNNDVSTV